MADRVTTEFLEALILRTDPHPHARVTSEFREALILANVVPNGPARVTAEFMEVLIKRGVTRQPRSRAYILD